MRIHRHHVVGFSAIVLLLGLSACATDITRKADPVQLMPNGNVGRATHLVEGVRVVFSSGPSSGRMRADSDWEPVGTVAQGTVYRPRDTVFQVRAGNAYEAYPVVSGGQVVGAYLPVQGVFIPARRPVAVDMEEIQ